MKFVFPRMEETFQARVDAIEGGIKRAEDRQAEANALFQQYQQQLAEARTEAARIRTRRGPTPTRSARTCSPRPARSATGSSPPAGSSCDAQRASIVRELRAEIGTLAVDLASRIVGESLADEARRTGTVDRFLTELDDGGALMQAASRESYAAAADALVEYARYGDPGGAGRRGG